MGVVEAQSILVLTLGATHDPGMLGFRLAGWRAGDRPWRNGRSAASFPPPGIREAQIVLILAPISAGELIDKITILWIKIGRIDEPGRSNVRTELAMLETILHEKIPSTAAIDPLIANLVEINQRLWAIEVDKRLCETNSDFGPSYVALARLVCIENDRRAAVKRDINLRMGSVIVEEKSHAGR